MPRKPGRPHPRRLQKRNKAVQMAFIDSRHAASAFTRAVAGTSRQNALIDTELDPSAAVSTLADGVDSPGARARSHHGVQSPSARKLHGAAHFFRGNPARHHQ
jgi:hypothetical protein